MKKEKKTRRPIKPNQNGTGGRRRRSLLGRLLSFLLTLLLGMAIVIGAEAAVVYGVFGWITLDRVEEYTGMDLAAGVLADDSLLRDLSVIGLVSELISLPEQLAQLTFNTLMEKYGVILSEEFREKLPTALLTVPLSELTGEDGFHVAMAHITIADVLKLAGEDLIPEPARLKIADRTLDLAADQKFDLLFEGVYLADFVGVTLEEDEDGVMQPTAENEEDLTILSYLATLDMGELFGAEDKNVVLQATLDRVPMDTILEGGDGNILYNALSDKMLGEVLKLEDGGFFFELDNAMEGLYLGDALGYELGEDGIWRRDGEEATGIYRELVGLEVATLGDTDLMETFGNVYVGELMEYTRGEPMEDEPESLDADEPDGATVKYHWTTKEGNEVKGMSLALANLMVDDLMQENLNIETLGFDTLKLHEVLGYELHEDGFWYNSDGEKPSSAFAAMMEFELGEISTEVDTLYVGELIGYSPLTDEEGNYVDEHGSPLAEGADPVFRKDGAAPDGVLAAFVTLRVSDLEDSEKVSDKIGTLKIGEAMGNTYVPDEMNPDDPENGVYYGTWYSKYIEPGSPENVKEEGMLALLMNSTVDTLSDDIDALYLGEVMGYDKYDRGADNKDGTADDTAWSDATVNLGFRKPNTDPATSETQPYLYPTGAIGEFVGLTVGEMNDADAFENRINGMAVGTALGYTEDEDGVWRKENGDAVTGILRSLCGSSIASLGDKVDGLYLGEAMGYDKYDRGADGLDGTADDAEWSEETVKLGFRKGTAPDYEYPGELMANFADMKVSALENESAFTDRVQNVRVGAALGYTEKDGVWYTDAEATPGNEVTGVFRTLAGYKVSEMDSAVKELKMADALGYRLEGNEWVKGEGAEKTTATGIMKLLMDTTLDGLPAKTDTLYLGEVMGYDKYDRGADGLDGTADDAEWSEETVNLGFRKPNPDPVTAETQPYLYPTGAISEFSDLTIKKLENGDEITKKIEGMTIGTAMNYKQVGGEWQDAAGTPVTNTVLLAVIDKQVGQMNTVLAELTLADAMGYKKDGDIWEKPNGTEETNSFILAILDKPVGDMASVMDTLTLGEVMGYHFKPDADNTDKEAPDYYTRGEWYKDAAYTQPADGGYLSIIGLDTKVSNLSERLETLDNVTIGRLMGAGLLAFDDAAMLAIKTKFHGVPGWETDEVTGVHGWQNHTVDCFINNVIKLDASDIWCTCGHTGD